MKQKLILTLATLTLLLALSKGSVRAQDETCQYVYGGQVCASSTPEIVDTSGESNLLFTISGLLYTTGLTSFVLAKNTDKFVPKI